jgi:hypothetical protein
LSEYCSWNYDRHGKRRVRFRQRGFSTYIHGIPWSDDFMRQYSAALEGMKVQTSSVGESRTIPGSVNSVVSAYLDCSSASTSPFRRAAPEIARFEATHPIGTKARLAYGLLLYTGQRRSDVVKMGPRAIQNHILTMIRARPTEARRVT